MKTRYSFLLWVVVLNVVGWLVGVAIYRKPAEASLDCVAGNLELFGKQAQRLHQVNPGAKTTFIAHITNPYDTPVNTRLDINMLVSGWGYGLAETDENFQPITSPTTPLIFSMAANSTKDVVISLEPNLDLAVGTTAAAQIGLRFDGVLSGCVQVGAMVTDQPKIYLISFDGLSPNYLQIGRNGEINPEPNEQLMPHLNSFIEQAAWFPDARVSLPAITDANVYAFYSGSWTGTSGLPTVGFYFMGWDENNIAVPGLIQNQDIRYGADGEYAMNIFDVAKDPAYGGEANTFTALISGKTQLSFLFRTGQSSNINVLADGTRRTNYMPTPEAYLLGDPPTDENAATDRDGINTEPIEFFHVFSSGFGLAGDEPLKNPPDDWVGQMAMRIIAVEDPEVFAIHFGSIDKIHHAAGAADFPEQWVDAGTPDILWDDVNIFNPNANREPILDVVYDADYQFGLLMDAFASRQMMDKAIIAISSDHSEIVLMNDHLEVDQVLVDAGLGAAVRRYDTWQEYGAIFLWDLADSAAVEQALESYTIYHRVLGETVHPFVVINKEEMDTGVDGVMGRFARDGGENHGELYSEWLIDYPVDDNSKVVWPDLFIFPLYHFQLAASSTGTDVVVGGHSSLTTKDALMILKSPDFLPGTFYPYDVMVADVIPTIYDSLEWTFPENVDGQSLLEILNND